MLVRDETVKAVLEARDRFSADGEGRFVQVVEPGSDLLRERPWRGPLEPQVRSESARKLGRVAAIQ